MSNIYVVSDFNVEILVKILENDISQPEISATASSYGQLHQTLIGGSVGDRDMALVWTQPEGALSTFRNLADGKEVEGAALLAEVDAFIDQLIGFKRRVRAMFVASWTAHHLGRGLGLLDMVPGRGIGWAIAAMNLRLAEKLHGESDVYLLDAERWLRAGNVPGYSPRSWFTTKAPFTNSVFREAALDVKAAVNAVTGKTRKLIVLDLDNTLWGGVVGEVGLEGLVLGGHSAAGEAFVSFQNALKALTRRGIQLAIASKNDESVAMNALQNHPEMVLRPTDFISWRINWRDKATNIAEIAEEVGLGLDSFVFLDDTPAERGRVSEAFPGVLVPEMPVDPMLYAGVLTALRCFDQAQISAEDALRAAMYQNERSRKESMNQVTDVSDWLESLDLRIVVDPLTSANLKRVVQLINKTNQMNMVTRRLSESDLQVWLSEDVNHLWAFTVRDRFGEMGLTGVITLSVDGETAWVKDFLLSCRIMGRKVEETMLHVACQYATSLGCHNLVADFVPSEKNGVMLAFLNRSGMTREGGDRFVLNLKESIPCPGHVTLTLVQSFSA